MVTAWRKTGASEAALSRSYSPMICSPIEASVTKAPFPVVAPDLFHPAHILQADKIVKAQLG